MVNKLSKETILIVDDTPENLDILNEILKQEYNIKIATSGEMAIKNAGSHPIPDLILLDIMMPIMDGYDVCSRLKKNINTKNIPVIFVTAKNDIIDESKGFEVGAVDYIPKPVSPPVVLARVKTHLELYNQNRQLEKKVRIRTLELEETRLEIIRRLGRAAEYKDNETGMHVIRMSKYSQIIALAHGVSADEAELILNAAPMHDIGKIGIPDYVLRKPGKLDDDEWKMMETHTHIGTKIIGEHSSDILQTAAIVAYEHHEKWNGKGYPRGLKGNDIHLYSRIVAIADVFDALTSERPYKKAWPIDEAVSLISSEVGQHFDPDLIPAFIESEPELLKIKREFPDNLK